jgi:DNA-binding transcriptional ArsR family regulator
MRKFKPTRLGARVSDDVERLLFALADPSRRTMVQRLAHGPATSGQLAALVPVSRPAASQHVKVLRDSKLVSATRIGREQWQQLRPDALRSVAAWLVRLADRADRAPELRLPERNLP